uniref:YlcI/YnfO family protein n=1 Tax=Vibrio vulnificus TaxID=672 RepID=UPI0018677D9D|nr:YlcI/YnfO family protein [Vibrio vulnificus]
MAQATKSARFPDELVRQIDESRSRMALDRGKKPSFSDWIIEAAAEKIKRESDTQKKAV